MFTLQCKVNKQKKSGPRGGEVLEQGGYGWFGLGAACGVSDYLFKCGEVFEVAFAAGRGDAACGLRAIAVVAAHDFDHFCFFENAEMSAEIAVSECAELLEIVEGEAFGVGDKRSEHAEARAFVDDAIEAFVCEAAFAAGGFRTHRDPLSIPRGEPRRPVTGRRRRRCPLSRE